MALEDMSSEHQGFSPPIGDPVITVENDITVFRMNDGGNPPRFAVIEMGGRTDGLGNFVLEGHGPFTQEECFGAWPTSPDVSEEARAQALEDVVYSPRHVDAHLPATDKDLALENAKWLAGFILGQTTESRSRNKET